jgi:16S rRNA (guanine527-N7)-methyltransferase
LPGLVIAYRRPELVVTLIERRDKRVDLLHYGVRALGLSAVTIYAGDVDSFTTSRLETGPSVRSADVITARSFGAPLVVLSAAAPIVRDGGLVLISDPPEGRTRWSDSELECSGFRDDGHIDGIRRFVRLS